MGFGACIECVSRQHSEQLLSLVFCTMVALLLFALLKLVTRRAGLPLLGQQVLAQWAALSVVVLVLLDGSTLRRLTGLAPQSLLSHRRSAGRPPISTAIPVPFYDRRAQSRLSTPP